MLESEEGGRRGGGGGSVTELLSGRELRCAAGGRALLALLGEPPPPPPQLACQWYLRCGAIKCVCRPGLPTEKLSELLLVCLRLLPCLAAAR